MSNYFKQIADDLLGIAFSPNDKRNNALNDLSIILMDISDDDIPMEQKDLINSIIKDMIAENPSGGAIDTTPKKPAKPKKVQIEATPVAQSTSTEIPDELKTIGDDSLVKEFPLPIQKLWLQRQKDAGNTLNVNIRFGKDKQEGGFSFFNTPEGFGFWLIIGEGLFARFKQEYGIFGEKLVVDSDVEAYFNKATASQTSTQDDSIYDIYTLPIVDNNPYLMPISLVKFFPIPIQKYFLEEQKLTGNPFDTTIMISATESQGGFDIKSSRYGESFWTKIQNGDFTEFKKVFGNNGETLYVRQDVEDFINILYPALTSQISTQNLAVLPATIMFDKYKDKVRKLPIVVQKLFVQRQKDVSGNKFTVDLVGMPDSNRGGFNWSETVEDYDFWLNISIGNLVPFKEKYGDRGEKLVVDADVEDFVNKLYPFATQTSTQVATGDLPIFINVSSPFAWVDDFPKPVQDLVKVRTEQQGNEFSTGNQITLGNATEGFVWDKTPEGKSFWKSIAQGDLQPFIDIFGSKGEGVDALVEKWENSKKNKTTSIPDFIAVSGQVKIKEFPQSVQDLIFLRAEQQGVSLNKDSRIFDLGFSATPEGNDFWVQTAKGQLTKFKEKFSPMGTGVALLTKSWNDGKNTRSLPDKINISNLALINEFPDNVKKLIKITVEKQGRIFNSSQTLVSSFDWSDAQDKHQFWEQIDKGNLTEFKKKYGTAGSHVNDLVQDWENQNKKTNSQSVESVSIIFYDVNGDYQAIPCENFTDLKFAMKEILISKQKNIGKFDLNCLAVDTFTTQVEIEFEQTKAGLVLSDSEFELKIMKAYDWVKPSLNWDLFEIAPSNILGITNLVEKLIPTMKDYNPKKAVTPKVEKPVAKVDKPAPATKVEKPKPVAKPEKVVAPKIEKPVKAKETKVKPKAKIDDDLSFLDIENLF